MTASLRRLSRLAITLASLVTLLVVTRSHIVADSTGGPGTLTPASLDDGLIAHYPFNGNAQDESANDNHGTVTGATLTTDRYGAPASAYSFDGVDDIITFDPLLLEQDQTVSAWVYVRSLDSDPDNVILESADTGEYADYGLYAVYNSADLSHYRLYYFLRGASGATHKIYADGFYDRDRWYQITGTYDGTAAKVYVNGQLAQSETFVTTLRQNAALLGVGDDGPGGDANLDGKVDGVRIYDRALNATEVLELYFQECPTPTKVHLPLVAR